jgi:hypothetical protein
VGRKSRLKKDNDYLTIKVFLSFFYIVYLFTVFMATSGENKTAGVAKEAVNANADTFSNYSEPSSQHLVFANLVKNRGGPIVHHEKITPKSSCNRCAAHRRNSLTDLRASPTNFSSGRHQDDNYNNNNNNHHHHPSCPSLKRQTALRSSIRRQHPMNDPKRSVNARLPPKVVLPSETEHSVICKQQPAIVSLSSVTTKQKELKSRIPVRTSEATSSSSLSLINNQRLIDSKKSMLHQPATSYISSSPKHSAATGDLFNFRTDNNNEESSKSW